MKQNIIYTPAILINTMATSLSLAVHFLYNSTEWYQPWDSHINVFHVGFIPSGKWTGKITVSLQLIVLPKGV